MLGSICLVLGLGTLLRFVETFKKAPHRSRRLLAVGTLFGMNVWLLFTANSATSLGCFIVGGTLMVVCSQFGRGRPWMVHLTVAVMLSVALGAYIFPEAYSFLVGTMGRNTTLTGRTELWDDMLRMVKDPWVGEGFESFFLGDRLEYLLAKYWWHPNEAHSGYLETYLTLGRIGLGLLALLMVTGYRNAINAYRSDPLSGSLRLAIVIIAPIYNYTEAAFKVMNPVWILFLLAVTAVPDSLLQEEEQKDVAKAVVPDRCDARPRPARPGQVNVDRRILPPSTARPARDLRPQDNDRVAARTNRENLPRRRVFLDDDSARPVSRGPRG